VILSKEFLLFRCPERYCPFFINERKLPIDRQPFIKMLLSFAEQNLFHSNFFCHFRDLSLSLSLSLFLNFQLKPKSFGKKLWFLLNP
jgi:hypothetical protein